MEVIENRVLRKVFGPKRDEVTRKWRRLYKEEWDVDWTGLRWLRIKTDGGSCQCGNKHSGSIKRGKFLDSVSVAFQEGHCSAGLTS